MPSRGRQIVPLKHVDNHDHLGLAQRLNILPVVDLGDNRISTNIGSQALAAFEVVVLKYDAFDQRVIGTRWTVTGKNSADWSPLAVGDSGADGIIGYGTEEVFTAIAYVRAARLADGTVWRANEVEVMNSLRKVAPGIKDFGSVKPDPKQKPE